MEKTTIQPTLTIKPHQIRELVLALREAGAVQVELSSIGLRVVFAPVDSPKVAPVVQPSDLPAWMIDKLSEIKATEPARLILDDPDYAVGDTGDYDPSLPGRRMS